MNQKNKTKDQIKNLPDAPGVYYFKNSSGEIIYVGKATSLRRRVSSYFQKAHDSRIEKLVSEIKKIDFKETPSVLEALILEANEIKRCLPKFNIKERDDKSFLYLVFTKDKFSKPILVRGHELKSFGAKHFKSIYGPYLSASSIRAALKILRKIFPYSTCEPPRKESSRVPIKSGRGDLRLLRSARNDKMARPCFYYHLKLCPGVCVGSANQKDYKKNIKHLEFVFSGKKDYLLKELKKEMKKKAEENRFEEAAKLRNQIFALEHIQDVAVLTRDDKQFFGAPKKADLAINIFGRIEGYDISNISGVQAVGSMVVFSYGEPNKSEYRKFKIKTIKGSNDVGMIKEILERRFKRKDWKLPDIILIDGGWGQVNAAKEVLGHYHVNIPIIGIAKGFDRKQDRLIYEKENLEVARVTEQYKEILLRVRDEAHRFAIGFHRQKMRKRILT